MKFLVLLFATAALASATFIGGKYIDVKEDGTIYIKGEDGKQIHITKHYGPYGKNIEIEVTGPNNFAKVYHFDYNTVNKAYDSQHDVLEALFREYLGHVDEYTYQQLLNKVQKAVTNGYFDDHFLYVLQALLENSKWDKLVSGEGYHGQVGEVLNKMTQQNKYGLGFYGKLFNGRGFYGQDYYNQYDVNYFYKVLLKIFDKKVLKDALVQEQLYDQDIYQKYTHENLWDVVFTHEGIFDHQYLVEIINNPVFRTWFIQYGYFDKVVLDKILYHYKTEGVYDHYLMQHLFNSQVLKHFFIVHGVSVFDILGHTWYKQNYSNTFYNKGFYGYDVIEKMIYNPYWRNALVQYGIFHKNVLDQILYQYRTEGVYDQVLLKQLINKEALYNFLVQYGVVDQTVLGKFVENEYLGLSYLYKNNFFQQTPTLTYKHFFGGYGYAPEYNNYQYGENYFKNSYGQQYYGYNQGPYSYGKFYHPYGISHQV